MKSLLQRSALLWNKFFFAPVPAINLCVFRILFAVVVLESAFLSLPDVITWYGIDGTLRPQIVKELLGNKCLDLLLFLPPSDNAVWSFYWIHIISAFCLGIGFYTRISSIVLFLTMSSLHFRNPLIINAGDDLMRVFAFLLMFAPSGACLSVDRLRTKRPPSAPQQEQVGQPEPLTLTIVPWSMRLMQIELTLLYFQYFWTKMAGESWVDGTAVYYVLNNTTIEHFPWPLDRHNELVAKTLTIGTLVIEFFLWNLIWVKRFRYYVLLAGVLLHAGLEYTLNIPVFQHVIFVSYILFVDPQHIERCIAFIARFLNKRASESQ